MFQRTPRVESQWSAGRSLVQNRVCGARIDASPTSLQVAAAVGVDQQIAKHNKHSTVDFIGSTRSSCSSKNRQPGNNLRPADGACKISAGRHGGAGNGSRTACQAAIRSNGQIRQAVAVHAFAAAYE